MLRGSECLSFFYWSHAFSKYVGAGNSLEKGCIPDRHNTEHSTCWGGARTGTEDRHRGQVSAFRGLLVFREGLLAEGRMSRMLPRGRVWEWGMESEGLAPERREQSEGGQTALSRAGNWKQPGDLRLERGTHVHSVCNVAGSFGLGLQATENHCAGEANAGCQG